MLAKRAVRIEKGDCLKGEERYVLGSNATPCFLTLSSLAPDSRWKSLRNEEFVGGGVAVVGGIAFFAEKR